MTAKPDVDVLIVGGGPVGLLLANLLDGKRLKTLLVEQAPAPPAASMAIGITPPSLELLGQLDLDREFIARGVPVECAKVHEAGKPAGELHFQALKNPYPFVLALPQADTIGLLEGRLGNTGTAEIRRGTRLIALEQTSGMVRATLHPADRRHPEQITASFLAGCDGHHSLVRSLAGLEPVKKKAYPVHFLMADFADDTGLGATAHLYFSPCGSIESFPLPGRRRRWIAQVENPSHPPDADLLVSRVAHHTGCDLTGRPCLPPTAFTPQRFLCRKYFRERVVLCGDAAHVMSPIGGQGMNTGFADAEFLAEALAEHFCCQKDYQPLFAGYDHYRRTAFKVAADRAARGMWLGTRQGIMASGLRMLLLKVLLGPLFADSLPAYFTMLSIPYRSLRVFGEEQLLIDPERDGRI